MSPVSLEAALTQSCYEATMLLPDVSADAPPFFDVTSSSAQKLFRIALAYQARGIRLARVTSPVRNEDDQRSILARHGLEYIAENVFSNENAIRVARSLTQIDERSLDDVELPPV